MKRPPYICLGLMAALSLAGCAHASSATDFPGSVTSFPTTLPGSVLVDDKVGIAVETAFQAAELAARTAVKAGFVTPSQAARLAELDNQAYTYVCYTRTAYAIANGKSPSARQDKCPLATKTGTIPAYADSARAALTVIKVMIGTLQSYKVAVRAPAPTIAPAQAYRAGIANVA